MIFGSGELKNCFDLFKCAHHCSIYLPMFDFRGKKSIITEGLQSTIILSSDFTHIKGKKSAMHRHKERKVLKKKSKLSRGTSNRKAGFEFLKVLLWSI